MTPPGRRPKAWGPLSAPLPRPSSRQAQVVPVPAPPLSRPHASRRGRVCGARRDRGARRVCSPGTGEGTERGPGKGRAKGRAWPAGRDLPEASVLRATRPCALAMGPGCPPAHLLLRDSRWVFTRLAPRPARPATAQTPPRPRPGTGPAQGLPRPRPEPGPAPAPAPAQAPPHRPLGVPAAEPGPAWSRHAQGPGPQAARAAGQVKPGPGVGTDLTKRGGRASVLTGPRGTVGR